jgi:hypothetical protein
MSAHGHTVAAGSKMRGAVVLSAAIVAGGQKNTEIYIFK